MRSRSIPLPPRLPRTSVILVLPLPAHPRDRELWLDTSAPSYVLKRYDMASATWITATTFKIQDLPQALETVKGIYEFGKSTLKVCAR